MCGRYTLTTTANFKKRFGIFGEIPKISPSWNISPGTYNPVVVRNSPNEVVLMKWGLIPYWANGYKIETGFINARSEGILDRASFKKPIRQQRCLIPATGFYEWKRLKLEAKEVKVPFYIEFKEHDLFSFAGIYDVWRDSKNHEIFSYAILTCLPNEMMQSIHNRMPVILKTEDEDRYLDKSTDINSVLSLLAPFDSNNMFSYPVSKLVNNAENNVKELVEKL